MANRDDLPPAAKPPTYEYARQEGKRVQKELGTTGRFWGHQAGYERQNEEEIRERVRAAPSQIRALRKQGREEAELGARYGRGSSSSGVPELTAKRKRNGRTRSR